MSRRHDGGAPVIALFIGAVLAVICAWLFNDGE